MKDKRSINRRNFDFSPKNGGGPAIIGYNGNKHASVDQF